MAYKDFEIGYTDSGMAVVAARHGTLKHVKMQVTHAELEQLQQSIAYELRRYELQQEQQNLSNKKR